MRVFPAWLCICSILASCSAFLTCLPAQSQTPSLAPAELDFFEKQVRPLLVEHCYECHSASEKNGGLRLDTRESTFAGGDTGPAIVAGQPDKSLLIEAVRYRNHDLQMPPKKPLSDSQVATLVEWVQRGAPDPREGHATGGPAPVKGMSLDEGRHFWSFQPISNPAIPAVKQTDWVRTSVDAFILGKLEEHELTPAPMADKRTLIRRATFDLIGLPPTENEVADFLADQSADAFEKVVDRLLDSPQYGVRWGRHWLDVARYADSNGLDENLAFGNAWRYRDYVVDAFNRDKPFDRFVMEQLAGDLLPDHSIETNIATGFLVLGAKVLAEPDREKLTMDTIDEQIDTLGKAFMGMTLGCTRCHDHKFDPISQADYYAMAAIFKSTKTFGDSNTGAIKHWHEINFASAEEKEKLKAVDAAIAEKQKAASSFKTKVMTEIREQARSQAVEYLIQALRIDLDTPLTEVAEIAKPVGLHPRILHHCRRHLAFHADDPFFAKWHELASAPASSVTNNIDSSDTSLARTPLSRRALAPVSSADEPAQPPTDSVAPTCEDPIKPAPHPIAAHYGPLFEAARQWADDKKKDPKLAPHADPQVMAAHAALFDNSGFLTVPAKVGFAFDEKSLTEYNRLAEEARVLESFSPDMPTAMSVSENKVLNSVPIHIRGSHRNLGQPTERGFPQVMQPPGLQPILPRHSSGRLELAQWLASSTHPLTARVYVNRIWRWHFGVGLVGSTENFGVLGDKPTHPELLDWLARNFIESGWSTKDLHRLIMRSSAYQVASTHTDPKMQQRQSEVDADNKWLSIFRMQRLDAEQVRDSILFVSGRLDMNLSGKSVPLRNRQFVFDHTSIDHTKYDSLRRAVYLPIIRNNLYTMFEQFDFPDPTMPTGHRHTTTVAPQALLLMNSELVMDSADALAQASLQASDQLDGRIHWITQRLFGREATGAELENIQRFIDKPATQGQQAEQASAASGPLPQAEAVKRWSLVCQSLMVSNEFFWIR